ncbi:MAG: hypothetical protein M3Y58_07960 [Chloroflexota bacterium]|nr:hypothetical protein [Chloroflexota bacterium]
MITLGPNELLTIHEGDTVAYFTLFPANAGFGQTYYGNYYEVMIEQTLIGWYAFVPAYPAWAATALSRDSVKRELEKVIKADLRHQEELLSDYIHFDPEEPGVDQVRVAPADVPVWVIVAQLEGADGNIMQVAEDYELPPEAVEAAVVFYRRNRAAIDARRAENRLPGAQRKWQPDMMPQP